MGYTCETKQFVIQGNNICYYDIKENELRKKIEIFIKIYSVFVGTRGIGVYISFGHRPSSQHTLYDSNPIEDAYFCGMIGSFGQMVVFKDEETQTSECIKSSIHVILNPYGQLAGYRIPVRISYYEKS